MRYLVAAILSFLCGFIYAATKDSDGNLILAPDEVAQTIALWNQMQQIIEIKNEEVKNLQKELEFYRTTKCL